MTYWVYLALAILVAALVLIARLARRDPDQAWVVVLYRLLIGPRTDVACMTRSELFRSAASFVTWTLFSAAVAIAITAAFFQSNSPGVLPLVALFVCVISGGMGLLAAAYLFLRGLFRKPGFKPPGVHHRAVEE